MKKNRLRVITLVLVVAMALGQLAFAQDMNVVTISGDGIESPVSFTMEDILAVPEEGQIEDEYIYNSRTGQKSASVKGVSLKYVLVEMLGLELEEGEVHFTASDGYAIAPQLLSDVLNDELMYVMAYEIDGETADSDKDPLTDDIVVYRKLKTEDEFGTVFKLIIEIEVKATETVEEPVVEEDPVVMFPTDFTDITEEFAYASKAIATLAEKGIINGVGGGLYAPGREFTRAEFAKILVLSLNIELGDYEDNFNDVSKGQWFAPYIQAAVDNGLFKGYTDGTFKPNQTINRQEMATVAGRAAVIGGLVEESRIIKFVMSKTNYTDNDMVADWAENYVAWLDAQGVFKGIAKDEFMPTKLVNRAEAAILIYNAIFAQ